MWFFHKGFNLINVFSRQRFEQLKEHEEAGRDTTAGCMVERNTSTMKRERDLNIEDPTDPSSQTNKQTTASKISRHRPRYHYRIRYHHQIQHFPRIVFILLNMTDL